VYRIGSVRGFVDLHCHWVASIDDGVKTPADGLSLLRGLHRVGFDVVVATPHMRPGMFDNDRPTLEGAFAAMARHLGDGAGLPAVHLASEHYFDDVVYQRLMRGEGLPYPFLGPRLGAPGAAKRGVLVELDPRAFPAQLQRRLFDLGRAGLRAVIAHPERYQPVWKDDTCLDPLLDAGACLLLDVCALVGKYGRAAQAAAEKLLDDEAYEAACSDAHRPEDVDAVAAAIARLEKRVGHEEAARLLGAAPRAILGLG
jgi:protein-tyrosine phosphatase